MKFVDEAVIWVRSGDGGAGCVSFRREKFRPRGGPDGGDGGRGGAVVLVALSQKDTLYSFHLNQHFQAEKGRPGRGQDKHGRDGADLIIELPLGTLVREAETGAVLADLTEPGQRYVVLEGGRGGKGNARFATATHRTPRQAQPGEPGREVRLRLELKLLADVGLTGPPNSGKSTLLSRLSAARPKIAPYPFTTLLPCLGVVSLGEDRSLILADIPGLIEGASQGAGLGTRFLRHIQRCTLLLYLLDAGQVDPAAPLADYEQIRLELAAFDPGLVQKSRIVALNKMDLPGTDRALAAVRAALPGTEVYGLSALTGQGLEELKEALFRRLGRAEEGGA